MTKRTYRAAASKNLITVLVVAVLAAGIYWIVRLRSSDNIDTSGSMTIYCPTDGKQEVTDVKWEGRNFLCPECNLYVASLQDPGTKSPSAIRDTP